MANCIEIYHSIAVDRFGNIGNALDYLSSRSGMTVDRGVFSKWMRCAQMPYSPVIIAINREIAETVLAQQGIKGLSSKSIVEIAHSFSPPLKAHGNAKNSARINADNIYISRW